MSNLTVRDLNVRLMVISPPSTPRTMFTLTNGKTGEGRYTAVCARRKGRSLTIAAHETRKQIYGKSEETRFSDEIGHDRGPRFVERQRPRLATSMRLRARPEVARFIDRPRAGRHHGGVVRWNHYHARSGPQRFAAA
jgi:hypothetical protein